MAKTGTNGININAFNGDVTTSGTIRVNNGDSINQVAEFNYYEDSSATKIYPSMAIGEDALASYIVTAEGDSSVAIGFEALKSMTTGYNSTGVGFKAGHNYSTGNGNTCVGAYAGGFSATDNQGLYNTFVGSTVGSFATEGGENVGLGMGSLYYLSTGSRNMAIGRGALQEVTTGSNNVSVGYLSGRFVDEGIKNTFLGDGLHTGTNVSNTLIVGAGTRKDVFADANGIKLGDGVMATEVHDFIIGNAAALDFADDGAAAVGGVPVNGVYHTAGALKVRLA